MVARARPSREDYYRVLAASLPPDALVVTALGNASYLWSVIHEAPENFYIEDSMGLALPLAVGLAVAQPDRKVIVVEGDGGLLMHMGGLVTAGAVAPANLSILLIDNGVHGASGGQALASPSLDFSALARAAGFERTERVETPEALSSALAEALGVAGPTFLSLVTEPDLQVVVPPAQLDPVVVKHRFMEMLGVRPYLSVLFQGAPNDPA